MVPIRGPDRRANRASREGNQHVVDDRVAGRQLESPSRLEAAEHVTRFDEDAPRRQQNPSSLLERRLHALHETAISYRERAGAEFHQDDCAQVLDGVALEQDVLVAAGVEPINVDVGIDDARRPSREELFELSFACTLPERSIDVGLRHDEAESSIERLGFSARGEHFSSLVELSLVYPDVFVSNRCSGCHLPSMYIVSAIVYTGTCLR